MPAGSNGSSLINLNPDAGAWVLEGSFVSTETQDAATDTLSPVGFGVSKSSITGLVSYDSNTKCLEFIKGGFYLFKTRERAGRVGSNNGESELFLQSQVSFDEINWSNVGESIDIKIEDTKEVNNFFDINVGQFTKGVFLRQVFARSSNGVDAGSLVAGTPSLALQATGIGVSPSAQLDVYRLKGYNYV